MAVYTVLERAEIEAFIEPYGIGPLIDFRGVAAGIENTNYFLSTDHSDLPSELRTRTEQEYVLTIFEASSPDELAFFIELTTLLNHSQLPVPCPLENADGIAIQQIQGKPAVLVPKVSGNHPQQPSESLCHAIGVTLAKTHQVCLQAKLQHQSSRSLSWLSQLATELKPRLNAEDLTLLEEVSRFQQLIKSHSDLPVTVIHGDLFRDNALAAGDQLTGIIDFNSAGDGYLMMDIAVVVNDWCANADGSLQQSLVTAIMTGYQQIRPFTSDEVLLWNDFLRIAASRFWLSRLATKLDPNNRHRPGGLVEQKDPEQYRRILLHRISTPQKLS
ncbi:homoserine kinase [Oceanicoccus sp. KOV_DT_Chl]|uniref:homoserine kinase n=1 Tax=Oceanicoccus sp. KOV_DT_Chl TaxID=1904639 RepID=UPI000C7D7302|nr:homoserine kinase [Oceanicoccus sp. KOV_DT_Chl]